MKNKALGFNYMRKTKHYGLKYSGSASLITRGTLLIFAFELWLYGGEGSFLSKAPSWVFFLPVTV